MRIFVLAVLVIAALSEAAAFAATRALFLPSEHRVMITLQAPAMGPQDRDAEILYEAMLVEPNGGIKELTSSDGVLSITCRSQESYSCLLVIRESNHSMVSAPKQTAGFWLAGTDAREMTSQFRARAEGGFSYSTSDRFFSIRGSDSEFRVSYQR